MEDTFGPKEIGNTPRRKANQNLLNAAKIFHWKKGESGNPSGVKGKDVVRVIPSVLRQIGKSALPPGLQTEFEKYFPDAKNATFMEAVLKMTYFKALTGNEWAVKFIAERTEGKTVDLIEEDTDKDDRNSFIDSVGRTDSLFPCKPEINSTESTGFYPSEISDVEAVDLPSCSEAAKEAAGDDNVSGNTQDDLNNYKPVDERFGGNSEGLNSTSEGAVTKTGKEGSVNA